MANKADACHQPTALQDSQKDRCFWSESSIAKWPKRDRCFWSNSVARWPTRHTILIGKQHRELADKTDACDQQAVSQNGHKGSFFISKQHRKITSKTVAFDQLAASQNGQQDRCVPSNLRIPRRPWWKDPYKSFGDLFSSGGASTNLLLAVNGNRKKIWRRIDKQRQKKSRKETSKGTEKQKRERPEATVQVDKA